MRILEVTKETIDRRWRLWAHVDRALHMAFGLGHFPLAYGATHPVVVVMFAVLGVLHLYWAQSLYKQKVRDKLREENIERERNRSFTLLDTEGPES